MLTATALTAVAPISERQGHYLVDVLRPVVAKLAHLRVDPPHGLTPEQRGAIDRSFGHAAAVLGEQSGEKDWLEQAVSAYRTALEVRTRERVPLDWAMTQNNLGNALRALGEREEGTERLAEAVDAYRAALDVFEASEAGYYIHGTRENLVAAEALLGGLR